MKWTRQIGDFEMRSNALSPNWSLNLLRRITSCWAFTSPRIVDSGSEFQKFSLTPVIPDVQFDSGRCACGEVGLESPFFSGPRLVAR